MPAKHDLVRLQKAEEIDLSRALSQLHLLCSKRLSKPQDFCHEIEIFLPVRVRVLWQRLVRLIGRHQDAVRRRGREREPPSDSPRGCPSLPGQRHLPGLHLGLPLSNRAARGRHPPNTTTSRPPPFRRPTLPDPASAPPPSVPPSLPPSPGG